MNEPDLHTNNSEAARRQLAAEASIIGSFMRDRSLIADLGDISPAHFTSGQMADAWRSLMNDPGITDDLALQIAVPNLTTAQADFIGRSNHPRNTVLRARAHLMESRGRAQLRKIFQDGLKALDGFNENAMLIGDRATRDISTMSASSSRSSSATELAVTLETQEQAAPVSTGIRALDYVSYGGLHIGGVLGIFARYKAGKTVMAATISRNLEKRHVPTLLVSLERRKTDTERFIVARSLGIDARDLDLRNNQAHRAAFEEYKQDKRYLRYIHRPGITIDELRANIMAEVAAHGVKVVIVDYWQLITNPKSNSSQQEKQQEAAQMLADLASTLDISIVIFGQLNQEGQPRGGEGILAAAGIVVRINRPEDADQGFFETMVSNRGPALTSGNPNAPSISLSLPGPHFTDYFEQAA